MPGRHEVVWDGQDSNGVEVATGVYFVRLETSEGSSVRRMILIR